MKLTVFNGIAYDLAAHLDSQAFAGYFRDIEYPVDTNALEEKDTFDKMCSAFVKERIPKNFEQTRIKKIMVHMRRSAMTISVKISIIVDDKEFSYGNVSLESR